MSCCQEGRAAFHRGTSSRESPYDDTERRVSWVRGWYDSKRDYNNALEKLGLNSVSIKHSYNCGDELADRAA